MSPRAGRACTTTTVTIRALDFVEPEVGVLALDVERSAIAVALQTANGGATWTTAVLPALRRIEDITLVR